jgi:c-di-AMP phosphodiesterase-like protein
MESRWYQTLENMANGVLIMDITTKQVEYTNKFIEKLFLSTQVEGNESNLVDSPPILISKIR